MGSAEQGSGERNSADWADSCSLTVDEAEAVATHHAEENFPNQGPVHTPVTRDLEQIEHEMLKL